LGSSTGNKLAIYSTGTDFYGIGVNTIQENLIFTARNNSVLFVNSGGRVGINTTAPGAMLDVSGSARFGNNNAGDRITIRDNIGTMAATGRSIDFTVSDSVFINRTNGQSFSIFEGTSDNQFFLASGGNLGLGTVAPTSELHIRGGDKSLRLEGPLGTYNYGAHIEFGDTGLVELEEYGDDSLSIYASSEMWINSPEDVLIEGNSIAIGAGAFSDALNDPSVAIGNLAEALGSFSQAIGPAALAFGNESVAFGPFTDATADGSFVIGRGVSQLNPLLNTDPGSMYFGNNSDIPTMVITGSSGNGTTGNVGIGTSTPLATLEVNGSLDVTGGPKNFRIDHPADPKNKYLYHAAIESDEVLNMYTGKVTTDANGEAVVRVPDYVDLVTTDFRYNLTVIGQFAQAIVAKEFEGGQFTIRTDKPNVKVSWQLIGNRNDPYMKANPYQAVRDKPEAARGYYTNPELYGQPLEAGVDYRHQAKKEAHLAEVERRRAAHRSPKKDRIRAQRARRRQAKFGY
jgi:hypothetical protein